MAELLTGCNRFLHSNLCSVVSTIFGVLAAAGVWFGPILISDAQAQAVLNKAYEIQSASTAQSLDQHIRDERQAEQDRKARDERIMGTLQTLAQQQGVIMGRLGIADASPEVPRTTASAAGENATP